ncbi:roadblock/LC7 domain-containing protein [Streptomyces sp. NPDC059015]|uniref:roadblock/LC7 domain-containing protein n=1 Tax=unclassified Streptomyces TaxID=2593676 RepID=UPI0036AD71AF
MNNTTHKPGEIDWLLDDLVSRVPQIRHAVVLSSDGLVVGACGSVSQEDAEVFAAISSGFHSLAKGAGRHFEAGDVVQTVAELKGGMLFVVAAGEGSCLAVLSSTGADVGVVAYEMATLVRRVGEHLTTPARAVDDTVEGGVGAP